MKSKSVILLCITLLALAACGERSEPAATKCNLCGMDPSVSRGRFLVEFTDGTRFDTCSGHCAAMLAAKQSAEAGSRAADTLYQMSVSPCRKSLPDINNWPDHLAKW